MSRSRWPSHGLLSPSRLLKDGAWHREQCSLGKLVGHVHVVRGPGKVEALGCDRVSALGSKGGTTGSPPSCNLELLALMSGAWPNVRASCHQPKGVPYRGQPLRMSPLSFPRELSGFKTFQELSLEPQRGGILPACCRGGSAKELLPPSHNFETPLGSHWWLEYQSRMPEHCEGALGVQSS